MLFGVSFDLSSWVSWISDLPGWFWFWSYVIVTGHITTETVTIYLHRYQTHRSVLYLAPLVEHLCRFWGWFFTSINTRQWVSVHRKHHHLVDKKGDPHSPFMEGIFPILFAGVWYYRREAHNPETIKNYQLPTLPNDWMEKNIYVPFQYVGVLVLLAINISFCAWKFDWWWGVVAWALQMIWIPFFAAGVLNGLGHYFGYRNFETFQKHSYFFLGVYFLVYIYRRGGASQQPPRGDELAQIFSQMVGV